MATYAHLLIVAYVRGDTAAASTGLVARFNADAAANYDYQIHDASATTKTVNENFAATSALVGRLPANTAGANLFSANIIFVPHYAGSANNKVALSLSAIKVGVSTSNLTNTFAGGFWRSSAAINRITLLPGAGNFVAGTRVTIYGMGA